ncbi:hypothetical protein B0T21DRAFT_92482 [Apiosordaria backusii]|uniref:Uncharacterized protein n=1 Tax=Apiosordaria backusii TaxID=314023 RepID=A0AA40ESK7_9PEZI|nr:hypothetical protein B0T21DRAFT_92482 [Apiosordaria backusii]
MATPGDLEILPRNSARVRLNSRGLVEVERVLQTNRYSDSPWLAAAGPPGEEVYLAQVTAVNIEELAATLRCQRDGQGQMYNVIIRAITSTPSQAPENPPKVDEHYDGSDTPLINLSRRRKKGKAGSSSQLDGQQGRSNSVQSSQPYSQVTPQSSTQGPEPNSPSLFFHWSHAENQKALKQRRVARIAGLVLQTQKQRDSAVSAITPAESESDSGSSDSGSSDNSWQTPESTSKNDPLTLNKARRDLKSLLEKRGELRRKISAAKAVEDGGDHAKTAGLLEKHLRWIKASIRARRASIQQLEGV